MGSCEEQVELEQVLAHSYESRTDPSGPGLPPGRAKVPPGTAEGRTSTAEGRADDSGDPESPIPISHFLYIFLRKYNLTVLFYTYSLGNTTLLYFFIDIP